MAIYKRVNNDEYRKSVLYPEEIRRLRAVLEDPRVGAFTTTVSDAYLEFLWMGFSYEKANAAFLNITDDDVRLFYNYINGDWVDHSWINDFIDYISEEDK